VPCRLSGSGDAVVDGYKLLNLLTKSVRSANADLFGNGEHHLHRDGRCDAVVGMVFEGRQQAGDASLVVKMPGHDEAVVEEFRLRIDGNHVANIDDKMSGLAGIRGWSWRKNQTIIDA